MRNQAPTAHAKALTAYSGEHFNGRKISERGRTAYSFSARGVTVARGDAEAVEVPIVWAFGSGVQAVTPVIERNGKWVEHRLSWYRAGDRLGLTPGHSPQATLDLEEALGVVQTERNATRCFGCHQTLGQPGVYCQACHGDGAAHRSKPARGTIARDRSVAVCVRCHRAPDAEFASPEPELEDTRSIRFAPVGFLASKCYQKSKGAFTCVSCHDPHGEPGARPAVNAVCAGCHRTRSSGKCPRTADCVSCHMKQASPMPVPLRFTDHRIRVY